MSKNKKKNLGGRNRQKGHDAERYYVNVFKEMGFSFCATARLASRLYDNAKVDLVNLPFNVQIKAGVQKSMNPGKELFNMSSTIKSLFPPEDTIHEKACFLIHYKQVGSGNKRTDNDEVVYMSRVQFDKYNQQIGVVYEKSYKFEIKSEFKDIIGITFKDFKEKIINNFYKNDSNSNTERED